MEFNPGGYGYEQCIGMIKEVQVQVSLSGYWPSERRALLEHKYFLGLERGYDPPLEEAIESWERRYARQWRTEKMRRDAEAQLREIEAYRQRLIGELGRLVDFAEAARCWIRECEAQWRDHWEAGPQSNV